MNKRRKTSPKTVALFAALWIVTYIICLLSIKKLSPEISIGIILSILPVAVFAIFIFYQIRSVASMDEVQIRIQMEAAVIAFSLGLLMIMTLGLLDLVVSLNEEDWSYRHLVPYMAIFYFLGLFISKRKYNFDDEKHD